MAWTWASSPCHDVQLCFDNVNSNYVRLCFDINLNDVQLCFDNVNLNYVRRTTEGMTL